VVASVVAKLEDDKAKAEGNHSRAGSNPVHAAKTFYMSQDLFYSHHEKILFLITGYDGSHLVKDMISKLQNNYNHMKRISGGATEIYSDEILYSRRYKSMRYFWCKTDVIPDNAFVIGKEDKADDPNKWTVHKWIHD
jgi:hypothetical protein